MIELFPVIMFFIGFYGLIISKKIIKSIVFILVMETAVIMFFIITGSRGRFHPPIEGVYGLEGAVDPVPQALMITAIIIGLAVTAVNLTMLISLFRECKSTDWAEVREIVKKKYQ